MICLRRMSVKWTDPSQSIKHCSRLDNLMLKRLTMYLRPSIFFRFLPNFAHEDIQLSYFGENLSPPKQTGFLNRQNFTANEFTTLL